MEETWDREMNSWEVRQPLSNGQDLILMVSDGNFKDVWYVELIVTDRGECLNSLDDDEYESYWDSKAGRAIGPGGLEVWGYAGAMLRRAEELILKDSFWDTPILSIGAASLALHKIYGKVLPRFGYIQVAGEYLKMLESK